MSKHKDIKIEDLGLSEEELEKFAAGARHLFGEKAVVQEKKTAQPAPSKGNLKSFAPRGKNE